MFHADIRNIKIVSKILTSKLHHMLFERINIKSNIDIIHIMQKMTMYQNQWNAYEITNN